MGKYETLAKDIVKEVGGKENINSVIHCATRLRFDLKDNNLANTETVKDIAGVIQVLVASGQYQVVIGNHVDEVHKEVLQEIGLSSQQSHANEPSDKSLWQNIFGYIGKIFGSMSSVLVAAGILKGVLSVLTTSGLMDNTSTIGLVLLGLADAMFYFLPVLVGYGAAKAFGLTEALGIILGAFLVYPTLVGMDVDLFGFSTTITYTSTMLPIIFIVLIASKVEAFFMNILPDVIKRMLTPLFVLLIAGPFGYFIIGPAINYLGTIISQGITSIYNLSPIIAATVIGFAWQFLVASGMHMALMAVGMVSILEGKPDPVLAITALVSWSQTAVVFAIFLKTKNQKLKETALGSGISGLFGITEPAIYGVTLPRMKYFIISCMGGALTGLYMGIFRVVKYGITGQGVFNFLSYINPADGDVSFVIHSVVASIIGLVFSFICTFVLYKDEI